MKPRTNWWMIGSIIIVLMMFLGLVTLGFYSREAFRGLLLVVVMVILGIASIGVYFTPTIIAIARRHRQIAPIILLNVFLGWTFLGWIGAMIWSVADYRK